MRRPLVSLFALAFLGATPAAASDADDIVAKANHMAYYQGQDGKAKVHMSIVDSEGRERTRDFTILRLNTGDQPDGEQKFYVFFRRPADVNKTAFMVWKHPGRDDDRWLYLPALDLVKRIAASDERTSFVGSHFFYEDVSGRNPDEDTHELVEETDNFYVLNNVPKDPDKVEFASYKVWVHKATFLPIKSEFVDSSGKVYRTIEALKVDTIDGFPTVTQARVTDTRMGGATTMTYQEVVYNIGLPEDIFSERYLRNAPKKYLR